MAVISATSTTAQIGAAYLDNCGYLEDDDPAMARRFVTAANAMLKRGIRSIEHAGEKMEFAPAELRELILDARRFLQGKNSVTAGGSGIIHPSFEDFRT